MGESFLGEIERRYPGIRRDVRGFETRLLPRCSRCRSKDTADVQVGIIGRTIHIAAATSKFKLIPNLPRPGRYFCNSCEQYFGSWVAPRMPPGK